MNNYSFKPGITAYGIRNFGDWVLAAYSFGRITVEGERDFPIVKIADATLDEAFAWIIKGYDRGSASDTLDFIWQEIMGEGESDDRISLIFDAMAGTGDIKAVSRDYVYELITNDHMEALLDTKFGERGAA